MRICCLSLICATVTWMCSGFWLLVEHKRHVYQILSCCGPRKSTGVKGQFYTLPFLTCPLAVTWPLTRNHTCSILVISSSIWWALQPALTHLPDCLCCLSVPETSLFSLPPCMTLPDLLACAGLFSFVFLSFFLCVVITQTCIVVEEELNPIGCFVTVTAHETGSGWDSFKI